MWDIDVRYQPDEIWRIIDQYAELPAEEQTRLARLAQAGDTAARDMLILTNLRLIAAKVKPWSTPATAVDVIQEGIIGMYKAIEKYDPDLGWNFSTYAVYWIQQAARLWVFRQNKVHISIEVHEDVISVQMCMKDGITDPQQIAAKKKMRLNHVEHAIKFLRTSYDSLDRKMDETREIDNTLAHFIQDEHDHIAAIEDALDLEQYMTVLNERQRRVIELRFGFEDDEPLTFPVIAKHLGVTQQRAVQLYNRAIAKLQQAAGIAPKEVASCQS